jgi:hypothetical protein
MGHRGRRPVCNDAEVSDRPCSSRHYRVCKLSPRTPGRSRNYPLHSSALQEFSKQWERQTHLHPLTARSEWIVGHSESAVRCQWKITPVKPGRVNFTNNGQIAVVLVADAYQRLLSTCPRSL